MRRCGSELSAAELRTLTRPQFAVVGVVSAATVGVFLLASSLTDLQNEVKALTKVVGDMNTSVQTLTTVVGEQSALQACLPLAFVSVASGLREAAAGGPLLAMVAAEPAHVEAWLRQIGYQQYIPALAPLGGASLLLQTEASLKQSGVAPQHVGPLLQLIRAAAIAPLSSAVFAPPASSLQG